MTHLTDRQLSITLASLEFMQNQLYESPMYAAKHLIGKDPIVKPEEIEEICDLINDPDFRELDITTLDGVTHQVKYSEVEEFIIEHQGYLIKKKIPMRRKPAALPDLEPDEEDF